MSDQHPMALRPSGGPPGPAGFNPPPPSAALGEGHPHAQDQYQQQQSGGGPPMNLNAAAYTGRYPSAQYQPPGPQSQYAESARSRSSSQNYPAATSGPPSMATSPPIQYAQPIMVQHSGPQSSRPGSRSATNTSEAQSPAQQRAMPSSRPTTSKSPFTTPVSGPNNPRTHQILLINPNSTRSMTDACILAVRASLPPNVELTGYTAPYPGPSAIESTTDAILSTEAVVRDLARYSAANGETVQNFDGMIVACYSKHPLIDVLRESYDVPVIGIMEASLYVARMLGGRFGIVATGSRSKIMQEDQVAAYGLTHFYVGSEATHLGVLELESRSRDEVSKRVANAARALVAKGADAILLGCAGMVELNRAAKDAVRDEDGRRTVNVIDGVEAAVQLMCSLITLGVPTSKKGMYKNERDGRRTRGQNWL